jgi:formylglycine-generating enzyme required for sulfatase activity
MRSLALSITFALALCPFTLSSGERESEIVTNSVGMKLARIPAGKFVMGSPRTEPAREAKEVQHSVSITKSFFMGVHEVTQAQFAEVMQYPDRRNRATFQTPPNGGLNHPMENVEWTAAKEFCTKLSQRPEEKAAGRSYRLPTEAEWEYACRAGTTTAFHFGDAASSRQANFNGNYPARDGESGPYLRRTAPVGSYAANTYGLHDMHGNVAEWCADFYDAAYYSDSPEEDPLGPPFGVVPTDFDGLFFMVVRGGSWVDDAAACRAACRSRAMPGTQYRLIGFRVVCDVAADAKGK